MTTRAPASRPPFPCPGWTGEGHDYVWAEAGDGWSADSQGRTCSFRFCRRPAVMRMRRWAWDYRGRGQSPRWYAYCEAHNYGRVVHDGQVWEPRRADLDPVGTAP